MKISRHSPWTIVSATIVAIFVLVPAASAYAATLTLSSESAQVVVGNLVTVRIVLNSSDQAVNAAEGTLRFPVDFLQVLSLSKSPSVFSIWVEDPGFSNSSGQVTFAGGLPTPGYQGTGGTVLTVSFVAKQAGTATLSLSDADVTADDGMGTNVLQSTGTLQLTVVNAPAAQPAPVTVPTPHTKPAVPSAPTAPVIPTVSTTTAATSSPAALQAPLITSVTSDVPLGGAAEITGTSIYPGAAVDLTLQAAGEQPSAADTTVEQNGSFTLTSAQSLPPGQYTGSVTVSLNGEQSAPSTSFVINFEGPSLIDHLVGILDQTVSLVTLGILLGLILGFICGYNFLKAGYRAPVRGTLHDMDAEIHKGFLTLRSRINDSLDELERKSKTHRLTTDEKGFVSEMVGSIRDAEKEIEKEVRHPEA